MIFEGAIDAHVHLWDPSRNDDILILQDHPWLAPRGEATKLADHLTATGVSGAIVVQSAPDAEHSDWLIARASKVLGVHGVVAWVDPFASDAQAHIEVLRNNPMVCGIRLMLNRCHRPEHFQSPGAVSVLSLVAETDLAIECLCPAAHLSVVKAIAEALANSSVILDHCGLPPESESGLANWEGALSDLATLPNVTCKFSGLIEPFGPDATLLQIERRAFKTLDIFGPERLMLCSNFPVADLGGGIVKWADMVEQLIHRSGLSTNERAAMLTETALSAYSIDLKISQKGQNA